MVEGYNFTDQILNGNSSDPPLPTWNNSIHDDSLYREIGPIPHARGNPASTSSHQPAEFRPNSLDNHGFGGSEITQSIDMFNLSHLNTPHEPVLDEYEGQGSEPSYENWMEMSEGEFSSNQNHTMPTSLYSSDNEKLDVDNTKQQSPNELSRSSASETTMQAGTFSQMPAQSLSPPQQTHGKSSSTTRKVRKAQKSRSRAKDKGKALSPRAQQDILRTFKTESTASSSNHASPSATRPVHDFFRDPTDIERKHLQALKDIPIEVLCKWHKLLQISQADAFPGDETSESGSNPDIVFSVEHAVCRKNGMPDTLPQCAERRWACTCCKMSYKSKWNWRRHEESNLFDWSCPVEGCSTVYPRQDKLPSHLRNSHGIASKVDPKPRPLHQFFKRHCGLCGEVFQEPTAFLDHVALHWDGKKSGYEPGLCTMEQWCWDWPKTDVNMGEDDDGDDGNDGDNDDGHDSNDGENDQNNPDQGSDQRFDGGNGSGDNGGNGSGAGPSHIIEDPYFYIPSNGYQALSSGESDQHQGTSSSAGRASLQPRAQGIRASTWAATTTIQSVYWKSSPYRLRHSVTFEPSTGLESFLVGGVSRSEKDLVETMDDHCESILRTFSDNPPKQATEKCAIHLTEPYSQSLDFNRHSPRAHPWPTWKSHQNSRSQGSQEQDGAPSPKIHHQGNDQQRWLEFLAEILTLDPTSPKVDPGVLQLHNYLMSCVTTSNGSISRTQKDNRLLTSSMPVKEADGATVSLSAAGRAKTFNQLLMSMNVKPTKKMKRVLEKSLSDFFGGNSPQSEFVLNLSLPRFRSYVVVKGLVNGVTGQVNVAMQLSTGASVLSRFISSSFDRFGLGSRMMDLAQNQNLNIAWTGNRQGSFRPRKFFNNSRASSWRDDEIRQMDKHVKGGGRVIIHDKAVARPLQLLTSMCSFHLQHALPLGSNIEPVSPASIDGYSDSANTKANLRQSIKTRLRNKDPRNRGAKPRASSEPRPSLSPRLKQSLKDLLPRMKWGKKRSHSEVN